MNRPSAVMIFNNLNVAFFDANGKQVPALQKSVAELICEAAAKEGYDMNGVVIETQCMGNWQMERTEDGAWVRNRPGRLILS